jgi:signal transduction histidine kinase
VNRVAGLERRLPVQIVPGPSLTIRADGDQLEQLLINLVRNAVDASLDTGGSVRTGWTARDGRLEVWVEDEGPGLPETANLFVPFFTTKAQGSGISLALSRQIAEAHLGEDRFRVDSYVDEMRGEDVVRRIHYTCVAVRINEDEWRITTLETLP